MTSMESATSKDDEPRKLSPLLLRPSRISKAKDCVLFMDRIEYVEMQQVMDGGDERMYYVMNVFLYPEQNRIPTLASNHGAGKLDRPESMRYRRADYQVARRYAEFEALRDTIWRIAHPPHHSECGYCKGFVALLIQTPNQPNVRTKYFRGKHQRMAVLEKFVNDLVYLTQGQRAFDPSTCRGHDRIPMAVRKFLQRNLTMPSNETRLYF